MEWIEGNSSSIGKFLLSREYEVEKTNVELAPPLITQFTLKSTKNKKISQNCLDNLLLTLE
jgi:hypothetical protein